MKSLFPAAPQQEAEHQPHALTKRTSPTMPADSQAAMLALPSAVGNWAFRNLIQTKLAISQPGDPYEQEADRVAEAVMRMPEATEPVQSPCLCGSTLGSKSACTGCQLRPMMLQRRTSEPTEPSTVPPIVHEVLRSPGRPLEPAVNASMGARFGYDFSRVRVHTDAKAEESARMVSARAYTVGRDVVFGARQYMPETLEGRKLLAHELTHTIQHEVMSLQKEAEPIEPRGPRSAADVALEIMKGRLSENILIDWWEGDCRDNNKNGRYDEQDPGEAGFGNHINQTKPGFRTIHGRPCLGENGSSVSIEDFATNEPVKYSVCARVLSESYQKAGMKGFPLVNAVRDIIAYFQRHQRPPKPRTSFWLYKDFPGDYLPGDFICSFDPKSQQGHAGMVAESKTGYALPLVVHLPGTGQRIWSGENNDLPPYDPRRLSDMTVERWPMAVRPIYGIGRYHGT